MKKNKDKNNNKIKKLNDKKINKNESKLFFSFFLLLYFVIAFTLMYLYNTGKYCNVLFDMDTRRAFSDMAVRAANHYRVTVHPLYVIINQPIVYLLKKVLLNDMICVALLESFVGSFCVFIFNKILQKIEIKDKLRYLITFAFGVGFSQLVFSTMPETYIEACLFALLGWYFFIKQDFNEEIDIKKYVLLFILGILSLSAILTNYIQFLIMSTVLICINKKEKNKLIKIICLNFVIVTTSITFAQIQNYIWPSAQNFFFGHINGILYHNDEELFYITHDFSLKLFTNVFKPVFLYNFNISLLKVENTQVWFKESLALDILSVVFYIIYLTISVLYLIKKKVFSNLKDNKNILFVLMNAVLLFNLIFHTVYGNESAYLYVANYSFAYFIILAMILNEINIKDYLLTILFIIVTLLFIAFFTQLLYYIDSENVLIFGSTLSKRGIILIPIIGIIFMYNLIKSKSLKDIILLVIIMIVCGIISYFVIPRFTNNEFPEYYQYKHKLYKKQIMDLKGVLAIGFVTEGESDYYFFGMASDDKYSYKDGKLENIFTNETIFECDVKKELIIPNEYMVYIETKDDNVIKIYENEEGLYIDNNGVIETIFERKEKINLPTFEGMEYSEILKVLHQETLFNFYESNNTPCVFTYKDKTYYRAAMLMTMVLEKTNNIPVVKRWADNVTTVYDNNRIDKETDNLGEMLYILYATKSSNTKLKKDIIKEIKRIKNDEGTIPSNIDCIVQAYYPTIIAKYALDLYGIDLGLVVPEEDDGYAKLTWYTGNKIQSPTRFNGDWYPYLTWAEFNYDGTGRLYMFNKMYPLSFEYDRSDYSDPYKLIRNSIISAPHGWTSSEMFLLLYNEGYRYTLDIK